RDEGIGGWPAEGPARWAVMLLSSRRHWASDVDAKAGNKRAVAIAAALFRLLEDFMVRQFAGSSATSTGSMSLIRRISIVTGSFSPRFLKTLPKRAFQTISSCR